MAMLEELERGLRRAEAAERILGASFGKTARPARKRQAAAKGASWKARTAIQTLDRTMAVIIFLWVASVVWCFLIDRQIGGGSTAAVAERLQSENGSALRSAETGSRQAASALKEAKAPATENHAEGLSVEAFEREVHRLFSENRQRAQAKGKEAEPADDPAEPDHAFPLIKGQSFPEPLAPPSVAKAAPGEAARVEADAQALDAQRTNAMKLARAKASFEKTKRPKVTSKQIPAPPPGRADQEPKGLPSFAVAVTETISGLIKSWSR
ncbi:hypothetical protein ACNHKD_07670 [Methylocystis sp. JAN1]|uniref:hypothetical protein n=1 Tax=Methylocystis sp. JAN1 TaxID=3397211 RepID=UPI003FA2361D